MKKFKFTPPNLTKLKNIPKYNAWNSLKNWFPNLEKNHKRIVQHQTLMIGGALMTLSSIFAARALGGDTASFIEMGGMITTGAFLIGRNWTQQNMLSKVKDGMHNPQNRQDLRGVARKTELISAAGYLPMLGFAFHFNDMAQFISAAIPATAYAASAYREHRTYKTRREGYDGKVFTPGPTLSQGPGRLLMARGPAQLWLSYEFYQQYGSLAGGTLALATTIQVIGAMMKTNTDKVYKKPNNDNNQTTDDMGPPRPPQL